MKYSYDNETQMVGVHGDDVTPEEHSRINRLNVGLSSMKSMSKYTREDPNTYVLQNMPDGLIAKAVKSSFIKPEPEKKESK